MDYYVEYNDYDQEVLVLKKGRPRKGWKEVSPGRWEQQENQKDLVISDEVKNKLAELQKVLHPLRVERRSKIISFIGCDIVGASQEIAAHFRGQTSFSRIDVDVKTGLAKAWKVVGRGKPDMIIKGLLST